MRRHSALRFSFPILAALAVAACGGGGGGSDASSAEATAGDTSAATDAGATATAASTTAMPLASTAAAAAEVGNDARIAAATATAQSASNHCAAIRPFYWEVGDARAKAASGSLASASATLRFTAATPISIASSSKWVYAAYVAQLRKGALNDADRRFLTMRSGYVSLKSCDPSQTVDSCLASQGNGTYTAAADGKFFYDGGHMQKHASLNGLGALDAKGLTAAVQAQIGSDVPLVFTVPQPPGGLAMSPDAYGRFLRKILAGQLAIGQLLGTSTQCTNPRTCGVAQALYTPVPSTESWGYSIGHWVENDPVVGDGAFSSAGAFGFYPWIDAGKRYYGIVARVAAFGSGYDSAQCGRLIRKAWLTGVSQ